VRKPDTVPADPADLSTPRWSLRSKDDSAFVFMSNHVRQYPMAAHPGLRFAVKLPHETLTFPATAVDVPDGAYFIWPVNFDMDGVRLRYATAQPLARIDNGSAGMTYVFGATAGIPVELGFDDSVATALHCACNKVSADGATLVASGFTPGLGAAVTIEKPGARKLTIIVLSAEQANNASLGQLAGQRRLVVSGQQSWFDGAGLQLQETGNPAFAFAVFPPVSLKAAGLTAKQDGLFAAYTATLPARTPSANITVVRPAGTARPIRIGGAANAAMEPLPQSFSAAAAWRVDLKSAAPTDLVEFDFVGDIGRVFGGTDMLDDWYYSGYPWQVATSQLGKKPLSITVLPLRADAPIYLPREARPDFAGKAQVAELRAVRVLPVYSLSVRAN
jgi:hypothetical protein